MLFQLIPSSSTSIFVSFFRSVFARELYRLFSHFSVTPIIYFISFTNIFHGIVWLVALLFFFVFFLNFFFFIFNDLPSLTKYRLMPIPYSFALGTSIGGLSFRLPITLFIVFLSFDSFVQHGLAVAHRVLQSPRQTVSSARFFATLADILAAII